MYNFIIDSIHEFTKKEIFAFSLLIIFAFSSLALLVFTIQDAKQESTQNQGYLRYVACVVDIRNELKSISISDDLSDACWKEAEKEVGVTLPRYSSKIQEEMK